jgi:integrase
LDSPGAKSTSLRGGLTTRPAQVYRGKECSGGKPALDRAGFGNPAAPAERRKNPEHRVFDHTYPAIRRAFSRVCEAAGIPYGLEGGVVIHTLRHSAASYLADLGVPAHILKMITRHSSAEALMKYTHASSRAIGEAIGRLDEISG